MTLQSATEMWATDLDENGRPPLEIIVNGRPLAHVTADLIRQLRLHNEPPVLYVRRGAMTRIRADENGRPLVDEVGIHELRHRISRIVWTMRANKDGGLNHVVCPLDVVHDILVHPDPPFPPLEAVVETPTLRPDGTIHYAAGYDPATRLLHIPGRNLTVPVIPDEPTDTEVVDAVLLLLSDLFGDFPFDTAADLANALALLLTPIVRPAISGQVPLALLDAPEPGTGKGLLASVIAMVATGRAAAARPLSTADEEVRKMLTSVLLEGPAVVVLDNVEDAIRAPSLAAVLTTDEWSDRRLGASETVAVPNRATWIATGNNLHVAGDIARRCYWIRLDAHQARPYTRTGFAHDDLLGWTLRHRGDLLAALLTLARSWWVAGQPVAPDTPTVGGFTPWARTVGGILAHAGVKGFLGNLALFHQRADVEGSAWETFLTGLHDQWGDRHFTVADIVNEAESEWGGIKSILPPEIADHVGRPGFARRIGQAFLRREGRRHGAEELAILKTGQTRGKVNQYTVAPMAVERIGQFIFDEATTPRPPAGFSGDHDPMGSADSAEDDESAGLSARYVNHNPAVNPQVTDLSDMNPAHNPADETPGQHEKNPERGVQRGSSSPTHTQAQGDNPSTGQKEPRTTLQPRADQFPGAIEIEGPF